MADLLIRSTEALARAVTAAGGPSGLSRALGGSPKPQAISQWKRVPAERVLQVEAATGEPRHALRPDLYPSPVTKRTHATPAQSRRKKAVAR